MKKTTRWAAAVCGAALTMTWVLARADATDIPVTMKVDVGRSIGKWNPAWRFFGYDECNYTYGKDGKKLLGELAALGKSQIYIRCHHLLTSGDGTAAMKWGSTNAYREDVSGNPIYDWTILDKIFDTYKERGLKPYVEIGFMPKDLSTKPELYPAMLDVNKMTKVDGGQAYPPKDFAKFGELIYQWTKHCVERYGKEEVATWYWEVWNEPDILYWKGTPAEYNKMYDYAVAGVRRALPEARVGGPDSAGNAKWFGNFIDHCLEGENAATGEKGSPLDFVSFHAKGGPRFVKASGDDKEGHVQMGIGTQLQKIQRYFAAVASHPGAKNKPIVIGEWDPEGLAAKPWSSAPEVGYRVSPQFASYEADAFLRTMQLAEKEGVNLEGVLTWSFEFEDKPWFAGFRTLATNGVDLPVMNVFRMLGKMDGDRVLLESSGDLGVDEVTTKSVHDKDDVMGMASMAERRLSVMAWNYHDDEVAGPNAAVSLAVAGLPTGVTEATVTEYRIDEEHSDAYTVWKKMGSPADVSSDQYAQLEKAGQLAAVREAENVKVADGKAIINITLPRNAVDMLVVEWK